MALTTIWPPEDSASTSVIKMGDGNVTLNTGVTQTVYTQTIAYTGSFTDLKDTPTTILGYGITDAKIDNGTIILGSNSIKPLTNDSEILASNITGVISVQNLPASSVSICKIVSTDEDRYNLTTDDVQDGDTVKVDSTGLMYYVIDDTKLNSSDGYTVFSSGAASTVPWSGIIDKPSFKTVATTGSYTDLTDKPSLQTVSIIDNNNGTKTLSVKTDEVETDSVTVITSINHDAIVTATGYTPANDSEVLKNTGSNTLTGSLTIVNPNDSSKSITISSAGFGGLANRAYKDAKNNVIDTTYAKLSGSTFTGVVEVPTLNVSDSGTLISNTETLTGTNDVVKSVVLSAVKDTISKSSIVLRDSSAGTSIGEGAISLQTKDDNNALVGVLDMTGNSIKFNGSELITANTIGNYIVSGGGDNSGITSEGVQTIISNSISSGAIKTALDTNASDSHNELVDAFNNTSLVFEKVSDGIYRFYINKPSFDE